MWLFLAACASAAIDPPIRDWIATAAIPLDSDLRPLAPLFADARIVGLGEATHGQSESFAAKRRLTMHLVRDHGFRVVAYEASAASARAADDYVQGKSDDRVAAIRGLSMLIWAVEENGELLDALREWNRKVEPADRVRFLGCDAQDAEAVFGRLRELIPAANAPLLARAESLLTRARGATQKLFGGDRADFDAMAPDVAAWEADVAAAASALGAPAASSPNAANAGVAELRLRAREFVLHLTMFGSPGGRDRAMADLLLLQLDALGPSARCVLWAHNGHVQRSALRYLGTEDLAQGGHLAAALGKRYVAVGFAFGEGEFQANAQGPDGRWGFRRYRLSAAPTGSLEHDLASAHPGDFALDLRSAPRGTRVQKWLDDGHGQRWYGGYQVPDDCDARTRDAAALQQTFPRADFDALVFLARTTAARPVDPSRILP